MSNNGSGPAFASAGRFDFTIRADDANVTVSRPVSREDVDRVRRQLADWESRHPGQRT